MSKLKSIIKKLIKYASKIEELTLKNWLKYVYFRNLIFVVLVPIFALLSNFWLFIGFFIPVPLIIGGIAFLLLDSNRVKIGQQKPNMLIKMEKFEKLFLKLFFVLYAFFILSLYLFLMSQQINIDRQFSGNLLLLISGMWTGWLFIFTLNALESTSILFDVMKRLVNKKYHHRLIFFPSSKIRARARFWAVSKILTQDLKKEIEINSKLSLFLEGMKIYNKYISRKFKFVIKDLKKFYCHAKLAIYIDELRTSLVSNLDSLIELMENEKDDPFEFIKLLKTTSNEPTDYKSLFKEFEVEPKPIRSWFSKNSDGLSLIFALLSLMVSIVIAILL